MYKRQDCNDAGPVCAALSCQHPDPGKQFIKIKRFDKIIIRSQIQPGDPVRNAVTGSQESVSYTHLYASADILVGMRIGLGYSWRAIIGAEMVAASTGLGHMILFAQQMSRTDKVIVGILVIGAVGYATDRIFGLAISKLLKGSCDNGWN